MLDDDLHFLADIVRMQPNPAHNAFQGFVALDLFLVQLFSIMGEFER